MSRMRSTGMLRFASSHENDGEGRADKELW